MSCKFPAQRKTDEVERTVSPASGHSASRYAGRMKRWAIAFSLTAAVTIAGCQKEVAQTRLPNLCIRQEQWPDLLVTMQRFATENGFSFHGGIEPALDNKRVFNAYVSRGHSYWFGDDFDLWIVSNPFEDGEMTYNALSITPWNTRDAEIANALLIAIKPIQCHSEPNGR